MDKTIDLIEKADPPTPPVSARAMRHDIMEKVIPGLESKPQRIAALPDLIAALLQLGSEFHHIYKLLVRRFVQQDREAQ